MNWGLKGGDAREPVSGENDPSEQAVCSRLFRFTAGRRLLTI